MSAVRRISALGRLPRQGRWCGYSAVTLQEDLLSTEGERRFRNESWQLLEDLHPERTRGFRIDLEVHHELKKIEFFTESMSNYEKLTVYMKHKNTVKNLFPEYIIFERHV
tara:strand:- start:1895 stop:2224 length:330 start_codon:yes stop_codon:yes gene_type:complete